MQPRRPLKRLLCVLLLAASPAAATGTPQPEDQLKAAVVLSFLRYTDWPGAASSPISIGVMGRPEFAETLRRLLEGKSDGKRPYRMVELRAGTEGRSCQLVYVAMAQTGEVRMALAGLRDSGALTIGESDRFLEVGGDVNLFLTDGRVSFEFRKTIGSGGGHAVSSKLLRFGQAREHIRGAN